MSLDTFSIVDLDRLGCSVAVQLQVAATFSLLRIHESIRTALPGFEAIGPALRGKTGKLDCLDVSISMAFSIPMGQ
jgi:hypothetical protein